MQFFINFSYFFFKGATLCLFSLRGESRQEHGSFFIRSSALPQNAPDTDAVRKMTATFFIQTRASPDSIAGGLHGGPVG